MSRVFLFHSNRAAAATDISGKRQKLLYRNKRYTLVAGSSCRFLQIQFAANGNAKYVDSGFCSPNDQGLKNLLRRIADSIGSVHSVQIVLIKFIERLFKWNFRLLKYADRVRF